MLKKEPPPQTSMQLDVLEGTYPEVKSDVLVLGLFEDEPLNPPIRYIDERLEGLLAKAHQKKTLTGEYKQLKVYPLNSKPEWVVLVGLGKKSQWNLERLRRIAGLSAKAARQLGKTYTTNIHLYGPSTPTDNAKATAMGTYMGLYQFTKYKTRDLEKVKAIDHVTLLDTDKQKTDLVKGANEGIIIAESVNIARDLVNTPSADMTPKILASEAKRICKAAGCSVDIWSKRDCEKKGMNAFIGVSKGSDQEPQLIVIDYGPRKQKPIVLCGKGVTFDTGGYSIKTPYTYMSDMKCDMAGAAAVIGAIRSAALLKVPQRIVGIIPATENTINGSAQKPGDVVKAMNGKTIEVINTDAEGRLVLADALSFAEATYQPQAIVDLATLTGAIVVALGYHHSGLFSRNDELANRILSASSNTGDAVWRMPLIDEHAEFLRSDVADIRNIQKGTDSGAIVGAVFLQQFVDKTPWAHIDIAGPAFLNEEREYLPKQGTGAGVRLLVDMLQQWQTMD
jgi:leucyl aminopeptidase